jgi:hypothetical protein
VVILHFYFDQCLSIQYQDPFEPLQHAAEEVLESQKYCTMHIAKSNGATLILISFIFYFESN